MAHLLLRRLLLPSSPLVGQCQRRAINTHHLRFGEGRSLAYREIPGQTEPTVVYVPGLHSYANMSGMMSNCLLR